MIAPSKVAVVAAVACTFAFPAQAQEAAPQAEEEPAEAAPPSMTASDSAAPRSPDALRFELSGRVTYATPPVHGGITPFGLGGGAGFDFVFSHVVLGGMVLTYWGGSDDVGSSETAVLYGAEAGGDFRLGPMISIRPLLSAGAVTITHTLPPSSSGTVALGTGSRRPPVSSPVDVVTQSSSIGGGGGGGAGANSVVTTSLFVAPGAMAVITPSPGTVVGAGGRILYMPSVAYGSDASAKWLSYSLDLNLGLRF